MAVSNDHPLQQEIDRLSERIALQPGDASLYLRRGKLYHRTGVFDKALNDFTQVLQLEPENTEAGQYSLLIREIFAYGYTDPYNP